MKYNKNLNLFLIIFIFSIFLFLPLLKPGFFTGHDGYTHIFRAAELCNNIGNTLYVRWLSNLSGGYGSAALNYYAPLIYYILLPIHYIGFSWVSAIKLFVILLTIFRGYWMYLYCKNFFPKNGALLASIAYIYVPYYVCNLYVRGALAEALGFSLIPLVLHIFYKILKRGELKYVSYAGIGLAILILSHNASAFILMPYLLLNIVYFPIFEKLEKKFLSILKSISAILLGACISSIFWIPAIIEKKYVHLERTIEGYFEFYNHFLSLKHLASAEWKFGMSPDDMPLFLGWFHIVIVIIGFIYLLIPKLKFKKYVLYFLILFASAIYLTLPYSLKVWKIIPMIEFLQFPWRFLSIAALYSSALFGIFGYFKKNLKWITLIGISTILFYSQYCKIEGTIQFPDSKFKPQELRKEYFTTTGSDEYCHIWAQPELPVNPPFAVIYKGKGKIIDSEIKGIRQFYTINAKEPVTLLINTYWFPGWIGRIDGESLPLNIHNPTGRIQLDAPKGLHKIELRFTDTPTRKSAKLLSIISFTFAIILILIRK